MANILILIGGHLCTAPRPQKEAEALANAGHNVTVQGVWFDPELIQRDQHFIRRKPYRFQPCLDFQPSHRRLNWQVRSQSRIAKEGFQRFNLFSPDLLGYGARAMLDAARQAQADLTIVHSEAGLWVGNQLLNLGFRVGVDFEDWFSEDLLPKARSIRPITQLKSLEARLLQDCQYCLTTSQAMAEAMAAAYQVPKPTAIYNAFAWAERATLDQQIKDRRNLSLPTLHWFSQTIGPGRGLETLFQALPNVTLPVEIHLRGNYSESSRQWLESLVPAGWRDCLFIHPTVSNAELPARIAEHDIGLALELSDPPSRNLTVTNKLFQYLQSGLAVIATDTAGQQEVFAQAPGLGRLIPCNQPLALAQALEDLLHDPEQLKAAQSCALQAAQTQFCWENQRDRLLTAVDRALTSQPYSSNILNSLCVS
jgi:glycosyltransferase involved in cell wall biosynthesis